MTPANLITTIAGTSLLCGLVACASGPGTAGRPAEARRASAASAGAPFAPGDVVAYQIRDRKTGEVIGRSHSTVGRDQAGGHRVVVTRVEADPGIAKGRRGSELIQTEHATTFRDDLSPVRYKRLSSRKGKQELRFSDTGIDVVADDLSARRVRRDRVHAPLVPRDDLALLALALARERIAPGDAAVMDVFDPEALASSPWQLSAWAEPQSKGGHTVVQLPGATATLDARGRVLALDLAEPAWVFVPERPPKPPPRVLYSPPPQYKRPDDARWDDRAVTVEVSGGALAGVLSVPKDRARWPRGAAPAVALLTDQRPHDRFGISGRYELGCAEWMDYLTQEGFVVLRLDDRGVGGSTAPPAKAHERQESLVADARAIVEVLERRPEVDPERIILIGHGDGGRAALIAAAELPLKAIVLIATPYGAQDKAGPVARAIAKVEEPVAIFQGLSDFEVSWKTDMRELQGAFDRRKKAQGFEKAKIFAYERVDHIMKEEPRTSSLDRYADTSRKVDRRFLTDLARWLKAQL